MMVELKMENSEQTWIEAALRESEERYRRLLESITDYIYTVKVENGSPVSTSHGPGCLAVTGYTSEYFQIYPHHWYDIIHEEDRKAVLEQAANLLKGEAVKPLEHRIIHKNGSIRWVRNTPVPHFDKDGELIAYDGIIEDITERRMAAEALKESFASLERAKREWEATFDAISDPLSIHDEGFRITRANRAYAEAAGLSFKDIIGRPYFEIFPKMEGPFTVCKEALMSHKVEEEEVSVSAINKIFRMRYYPVKDADGNYIHSIHIMEDITEQRRAEKGLKDEIDVTTHLLMIAKATAGTSDVDKLMEQVVHCCQKILGCDICLSYLWDKESRVFSPRKAYGLEHELIPVFMTVSMDEKFGFVKEAMEKKEPVIEEVGAVHELPLQWIPDIKTTAAIPLIGKKGPLGLIVGIYVGAGLKPAPTIEFTERDIEVMQGIMHQVSVALEEARLYTDSIDRAMELSHKIETIQAMHEIDRNIFSTLDPQMVLDTSTRMVGKVIACDRATIVLVDKERKGFTLFSGYGLDIVPKDAFLRFDETSLTEVIKTVRPQYISNLAELKKLPDFEKELVKRGFISQIRIPLFIKGDVVGVLTAGARRASAFTPDDLSTLEKMGSQISVALQNAQQLKDLEELFFGTVKSLSSAIDAKSPWTAGHSERVTKYALDIAKEMGLSSEDIRALEVAGFLHDIGKIGTYDILLDKPGKLEPDEVEIVRLHPGKGAEILEPIKRFRNIIPAIKHHHEFYDGTGYPDGLKGEAIPLGARILAVADTVDAMGADRPYRNGKPMDAIVIELRRCSGTQFDPKVVEAFLSMISREREGFKMAAN